MTVTPIEGERLCYLVSSESGRSAGYRVDLLANRGLCHCSCTNFGVVHWSKVKRKERSACKHIRAVREYFLDELLVTLSKQLEQND